MNKKILITLLIAIGVYPVFSQNRLFTNDTTISRKIEHLIPVYADLDEQATTLYFSLKFDDYVIDIKDFVTCDTCLLDTAGIEGIVHEDANSAVAFAAGLLKPGIKEGLLGYLVIEGLFGADSVSHLNIHDLTIDNEQVTPDLQDESTVTVGGELVFPSEREEISVNYPNPFYYSTTMDVFLTTATKLDLSIYDHGGRKVAAFPDTDNKNIDIALFDPENPVHPDKGELLPKGNYKIIIRTDNRVISSGIYYLIIETNTNIYKRNLMYRK